jgi:hypothetical protein
MTDKYKIKYKRLKRAVAALLEVEARNYDRPRTYRYYDHAEARAVVCKLLTGEHDLTAAARAIRRRHKGHLRPAGDPAIKYKQD